MAPGLRSACEGGRQLQRGYSDPEPLVSIVIVVYRDREELEKLVASVLPAASAEVEIIVIDGGSDDGTVEFLQEHDSAISYWKSARDEGIYAAMNDGIAHARGTFILHLNAGDRLIDLPLGPLSELASSEVDVVACEVLDDGTRRFRPRRPRMLRLDNVWHHQGTFYRRTAHLGYDTSYRVFGDLEHNQRIHKMGRRWKDLSFVVAEHRSGGVSMNLGMRHEIYRAIREHYGMAYAALAFVRFQLATVYRFFYRRR